MELGQLSGNGRAELIVSVVQKKKAIGGGFWHSGQKGGRLLAAQIIPIG